MEPLDFDGTYKLNTGFAVSFEHSRRMTRFRLPLSSTLSSTDGTPSPTRHSSPPGTSSRAWITATTLSPVIYEFVEIQSKRAKMATAQPSQPIKALLAAAEPLSEILHPHWKTRRVSITALWMRPHPEYWRALHLANKGWPHCEDLRSVVPTTSGGHQALLDKIVFTQMESSAACCVCQRRD